MVQLSNKINLYAKANGVASVDFEKDVNLKDNSDGKGAYIKEWNLSIAKPTDEQLNAFESEATKLENNAKIDATRRTSYRSWNEQLDEIYHNIDDWKARIKAVKDSNPKESS